jgi:hypothetical protein
MYRIEVAAGEVTVFRTIEEMAIGIRNGVITARARIYHHASQKWLPIGLHPHYKKALEMPAATTGAAPVTTATPIPTPPRLKAHSPAHSPAHPRPQSVVHYPEPSRSSEPPPEWVPLPQSTAAPEIPAPRPSPVIAMHHELLRNLPVVSIPEPLPWSTPAPQTAPRPVDPPAEPPPVIHAPVVHAPAPAVHANLVRPAAVRAPAPFAPLEFAAPVEEGNRAPTAELLLPRPPARRSRRLGGRPLLLLGTAASLVIGTHLVLTAAPSVSADPSEAPVTPTSGDDRDDSSGPTNAAVDRPATTINSSKTRAAEAPRVTIAPARVPMTPGPAFAGSVSVRPGADSTAPAPKATPAPAPTPTVAAPSITPPPEALELTLPDFESEPTVSSTRSSDTLGMKKILRALNGAKAAEAPAAE